MKWDYEKLAMYAKVTIDDIQQYQSMPEPKKKKADLVDKVEIQDKGVSQEAKNCMNGTANYSIQGQDGLLYCILDSYCPKRSTDPMAKDKIKLKRCLGKKR